MTVDIGSLDHESGANLCIDCLRAAIAVIEAAVERVQVIVTATPEEPAP